jgi:hypothetical protein
MDTSTIIIAIVAVVVILAVAAVIWGYFQKRRTKQLRSRFGPEYERVVDETGATGKAESILTSRQKRVEKLDIRALSAQECENFARAWDEEQSRFVDHPRAAVGNADHLVAEVMRARGYPVGDFEQRAADVSVDHPMVVENYRIAHEIAVDDGRAPVDTEALRKAMIHYRALFDELLDEQGAPSRGPRETYGNEREVRYRERAKEMAR